MRSDGDIQALLIHSPGYDRATGISNSVRGCRASRKARASSTRAGVDTARRDAPLPDSNRIHARILVPEQRGEHGRGARRGTGGRSKTVPSHEVGPRLAMDERIPGAGAVFQPEARPMQWLRRTSAAESRAVQQPWNETGCTSLSIKPLPIIGTDAEGRRARPRMPGRCRSSRDCFRLRCRYGRKRKPAAGLLRH